MDAVKFRTPGSDFKKEPELIYLIFNCRSAAILASINSTQKIVTAAWIKQFHPRFKCIDNYHRYLARLFEFSCMITFISGSISNWHMFCLYNLTIRSWNDLIKGYSFKIFSIFVIMQSTKSYMFFKVDDEWNIFVIFRYIRAFHLITNFMC